MGVHKKKPVPPEQGLLPGVEVPDASGRSTEAKKAYLAGYEDARSARDRNATGSTAYEEGYELGRKHGPKPPRRFGAHQRKAISAKRLVTGTPVEVLLFGKWVLGEVSHKGGDFFLFDGGDYFAVTVDRPDYWRLPAGICVKCEREIACGEGKVQVSWTGAKDLEHVGCGKRGPTAMPEVP